MLSASFWVVISGEHQGYRGLVDANSTKIGPPIRREVETNPNAAKRLTAVNNISEV